MKEEDKKFNIIFINSWKEQSCMIIWINLGFYWHTDTIKFLVGLFGFQFSIEYIRKKRRLLLKHLNNN